VTTRFVEGAVDDRALLLPGAPGASGTKLTPLARTLLLRAGAQRRGGRLEISEGGRRLTLGADGPTVHVSIRDPRVYGALLTSGSVGMGASYVAGWWDADDLTLLVRILFRWTRRLRRIVDRVGPLVGWAGRFGDRSLVDRGPAQDLVRAHYDLSNEFFSLMLDETMTYSCGVFDGPETSLRDAQTAKIDGLCSKLALRPDDHLIEIGTGWGGLSLHAARAYGCRVTTTTVSDAQRTHVQRLVDEQGLSSRVTVLGVDWRDLRGTYDKLVSVEMIEAVPWQLHADFIAQCARLLVPGGLAAIQAIVIDDRSYDRAKLHRDFIRRTVFPGSSFPSVGSLHRAVIRTGELRIVSLEEIGVHYPETLRRWSQNLEAHGEALDRLGVRMELRRLWDLYLSYCRAGFLEGHIGDVQLLLAKGQPHQAAEP
jgi:cyclopropane-fatty-acyl-phospholipid synthase